MAIQSKILKESDPSTQKRKAGIGIRTSLTIGYLVVIVLVLAIASLAFLGLIQAMFFASGTAILVTAGLAIFIPHNISKNLREIVIALRKMADDDLTGSLNVNSSDEIGTIGRIYNDMNKARQAKTAEIQANSSRILEACEQLSLVAKQSGEATQQVASASQQMAKGAQEQSNDSVETAKALEQLSSAINKLSDHAIEQSACVQKAMTAISEVSETMSHVAQNAGEASRGAKQAAEAANNGFEKTRMTLAGIDKIRISSGAVAKKIEELGSRSAEIGKIVAVINEIATQTNLLALNAAIEAARAGEQGKGFAVVSDEVRKLAERTADATREVAELIGSVQKGVEEANQVTENGSAAVAEGYSMAVQAGQSLEEILKAASDMRSRVEQISIKAEQVNSATNELVKVIDSVSSISEQNTKATTQMTESAAQVTKAMETVAAIAEENSASTQEMSASAQEMSAQIQEVIASTENLKDRAMLLNRDPVSNKIRRDETIR
jgi:methyl-accepting chemotaxis protein